LEKKSQNCPTHLSNFPKFIAAALSNALTALPKVPLRRFRSKEAFKAKVTQQHSKPLTTFAMTLAEQFRQEGRQEGREEGRQAGWQEGWQRSEVHSRRQALIGVLEARFGDIPAGLVEASARVSDVPKLESLLKHAAVCADLEAFSSKD
jgi:hypothetical protein